MANYIITYNEGNIRYYLHSDNNFYGYMWCNKIKIYHRLSSAIRKIREMSERMGGKRICVYECKEGEVYSSCCVPERYRASFVCP